MSNFTDFISGGSASYPTFFLSKSQTWVPPQDGNIMIHVIGGGGSGGSGTSDYGNSGSAAGYCKKNTLAVTTSGSFTVVVGAGGGHRQGSGNGYAGGNSTVAGTGLSSTLTSTGGSGGANSGSTDPAAGVGSNGDVNTTGGQGGYHRGGGAVGLTGTGENGVRAERNGSAGECDIVGDLWSSTMGQIAGGRRGISSYACSGNTERPTSSSYPNAEPFSGGGRVVVRRTPSSNSNFAQGGDGGIGGGGGAGINEGTSAYSTGGAGGAGLVVIQYIP